AGVIGLSVAYYCAQRGHRVTVIERHPQERSGCSFGNMGMIVPSHFIPLAAPGMVALGLKWMWNPESPFYIKPRLNWDLLTWGMRFWSAANRQHVERSAPLLRDLSFASRAAFEELEAAGLDFGLEKKGLLMLCKTEHALKEEAHVAEQAKELGIPADVLDAKQLATLEPGVEMSACGGVYFPKDCHLQPERFVAALEERIVSGGGEILWDTEVRGWRRESGRLAAVKTSRGEIEADEFVLCGGSWSPEMVKDLGLRLPMQAGKGYSLTLAEPRQKPQICSILTEARVAVTPMGKTLRFGGTMEIAGCNETISPRRVRGIIRAATEYYPAFSEEDFKDTTPWSGLRPCSPDGLPYLGRTNAAANLSIATGHAMMGLSLAPITGQLIAQMISGERSSIDTALLSPDRYA
ncbi:MAG: FAD-dependent oxidoreductase, partial [Verrucomicrobiaceae bacterium]